MNGKKILLVILAIVLIVLFYACSGRGYKDTAIEFVEAIYEADADTFVSLMSDSLQYELMEAQDASTEKILVNTIQKILDSNIESMKSNYGKKWKYDIEYIDSVKDEDTCIVTIDVTYTGKSWFSDKQDTDTIELELIKDGINWYVNSFPDL